MLPSGAVPLTIHQGYLPGAIGRIAALHAHYYHRQAGFGMAFEAKVARELAVFCEDYDSTRDGLWLALQDGTIEGSIAIHGPADVRGPRPGHSLTAAHGAGLSTNPDIAPAASLAALPAAHLRWFITSDQTRGSGTGTALLNAALTFCRAQSYARVYLWTFEGLHAARHLYEKAGFHLVHQQRGIQWGTEVNEQRFELHTHLSKLPRLL